MIEYLKNLWDKLKMKVLKNMLSVAEEAYKLAIEAIYERPDSLLIYYGWLNSFNSAQNGWDNEKVAQDMAKYNLIVLGDGMQNPSHGDFANTSIIIPRIKTLNPNTKIFGYVTGNQIIADFKTKAGLWNNLQVDGIFIDEAGYDYGKTRVEFNERVQYVHNLTKANICFPNAWNLDHILGTVNDASYPNTTYNSGLVESFLTPDDYCLLESFPINTTAYIPGGIELHTDWIARGEKASLMRKTHGINPVGCGIINDNNTSGQNLFNFGYISAAMFSLIGFGTSDLLYGASSAATRYWDRPDINGMGCIWNLSPTVKVFDINKYVRYLDHGKLSLNFSDGTNSITKY